MTVTPVTMHSTQTLSLTWLLQYETNWAAKTPLLSIISLVNDLCGQEACV